MASNNTIPSDVRSTSFSMLGRALFESDVQRFHKTSSELHSPLEYAGLRAIDDR